MRSFPKLSLIKDAATREALRLIFDRLGTLDDERAPTTALTPAGTTTSARSTRITNTLDPVNPQDVVTLRYFTRQVQMFTRALAKQTTITTETPPATTAARTLKDETGATFDYLGITQFSLFRYWLTGDTTTVNAACSYAQSNGFTIIRVIGMLAHPFWVGEGLDYDPNHPVAVSSANYYAQWPLFVAHVATFGLRVEVVLFADIDYLPFYQDLVNVGGHVDSMTTALIGKRVFFEIINEPQVNGMSTASVLATAAGRVKQTDASRIVALGSPVSSVPHDSLMYNIPPADYLTFHVDRLAGWGWVLPHATYAPVLQTDRYPISDEPMPGDSTTTPHDDNPDHWFGFGCTARLTQIGSTFHYHDGLLGVPPTGISDTCAQAYIDGIAHIPNGFDGDLFLDDSAGSPFNLSTPPQPTRIIGRNNSTTLVIKAVALEIPPGWTPTMKSGYQMQVVETRGDCSYIEGVAPGGGGGSGGGKQDCDDAPPSGHVSGSLNYDHARLIVCGSGNEFPQLRVPTATQAEHLTNAEELLKRIIWHLLQVGFTAGKQRNPSGSISDDKVTVRISGVFRAFDVFFALGDNTQTLQLQFVEAFPAEYVAEPGTAD